MINVTETAKQELTAFFADKDVQPIRVYLGGGGCAGVRLSLALDEPRDDDTSVQHGDFTFLISEELADATGAVTIDMTQHGFTVDSENPVGGGGCGCSGGCDSGDTSGCGC